MVEGLGELRLNEFLSVKNLLTREAPEAVAEFVGDNKWAIIGAAAPLVFLALPHTVYGAEPMRDGVGSTEKIGDLIKTLALPLVLGTGNAYRAWHSAGKDVEKVQHDIDQRIIAANETAGIFSADDIVWRNVATQLGLDPEASPEERQTVFSTLNQNSLEKLRASAEEELKTIPGTVAELTSGIKDMSKKRDKIWRRGAWRIPFEFGEGFLVGCFGMALIQPDGAPTIVDKFLTSTDSVEQTQNGLYLSGYAFASWTALRAMWKLQHAAGGRGRVAEEAKAHLKRMKEDAGEDVKENKRPKLNDQAKAMAGDPVAKAKMKMKNGK
jgi:hypothetical protein